MIIEKLLDRDGAEILQEKETGQRYARIIAGIGWPGIKTGFAVIAGEDFKEDPSLKTRHVRVFAEIEDEDLENLFQKCLESKDRYQVEDFYANTDNQPMMEFLYDFNRGLDDGMSQLSVNLAPFPEDLEYHARIIHCRIQQGERSLHLPENSLLKGYLMELGKEEVLKADVLDYPAVAVLGYVLSHIKSYPTMKHWPFRRRPALSWRTV